MANPAIEVTYAGQRAIDWLPSPPEATVRAVDEALIPAWGKGQASGDSGDSVSSPTAASAHKDNTFSSTDPDMRDQFIAHLKRRIREADGGHGGAGQRAAKKKDLWASLELLNDPTSRPRVLRDKKIENETLEEFFYNLQAILKSSFNEIEQTWISGCGLRDTDNDDKADESDTSAVTTPVRKRAKTLSETTTRSARPAEDLYAQRTVSAWYGHRCALSGVILPEAAHIVPVRVTKDGDLADIWRCLRNFWPLDMWEEKEVTTAVENILPLCPTAHRLWNRYKFALRPIADVADPQHKVYVQMVWLATGRKNAGAEVGAEIARRKTASGDPWDHDGLGSFADFRRGGDANGRYAPVRHGDLYQITTTDPDTCPLPSLRLLQIQFGAQKLMAGIRGAAALEDIFRGCPPADDDDDAPPIRAADVPPEWRSLVDAAVEAGVLDDPAADRWIAALTRNALYWQRRRLGEWDEDWGSDA